VFDENTIILSCVVGAQMPYARHVLDIFKLPGLVEFFSFVCHGYGVVGPTLLVLTIVLFILPARIFSVIVI
jgi:hypothetical protein